ncbi:MAG: hypothetical protein HQK75_13525 [Candidatus Magnetomorum sp.]|nr:hypothetical protein [Candidatus Magnetomorum sp.]
MYRFLVYAWIILCFSATSAMAIREDKPSELLQMDTNMSDLMSLPQPDSSLRFLQTLTNQQQDIQNLNATLQKNHQESSVGLTRLDQRIDFFYLLFWCLIAVNAFLFLIIIIMGIKIRSLSKKIRQQPSIESFLPSAIEPEPATFKLPPSREPPVSRKKFVQSMPSHAEDEELDELLSSVKDDDIAALFSDKPNENFFQYFQSEIDRERTQLSQPAESNPQKARSSSEDDLLDDLIETHFSDKDSFERIKKEPFKK